MTKAPIGALVSIYYDGGPIEINEYLRTPSGRLYLVVSKRVQKRGRHVGRQHLKCLVVSEIIEGTRTLPIYWYKRQKRA